MKIRCESLNHYLTVMGSAATWMGRSAERMSHVRTNISLPVDLVRRMKAVPKFNVSALVTTVIEERLNGRSEMENELLALRGEVAKLRKLLCRMAKLLSKE